MGFIVGFDRELIRRPRPLGELHADPRHQSPDVPVHRRDDRELGADRAADRHDARRCGLQRPVVPFLTPLNVAANGGGRFLTNFDDYATTFKGVEMSLTKRMSNRWMARVAGAWNNPQEHYDMAVPVNENGNPTVSDTFPLEDGGQWAPRSAGSGSGDVFINQRWNFNLNGAYQATVGYRARGQPVRQARHAVSVLPQRRARPRGQRSHPADTGARHQPVRDAVEPRPSRVEERQVRKPRLGAVDRRPVQRDEQRHGNHSRAQCRRDDVPGARVEPQPAHSAVWRASQLLEHASGTTPRLVVSQAHREFRWACFLVR